MFHSWMIMFRCSKWMWSTYSFLTTNNHPIPQTHFSSHSSCYGWGMSAGAPAALARKAWGERQLCGGLRTQPSQLLCLKKKRTSCTNHGSTNECKPQQRLDLYMHFIHCISYCKHCYYSNNITNGDWEIFTGKNFRLLNFCLVLFSSLWSLDEE